MSSRDELHEILFDKPVILQRLWYTITLRMSKPCNNRYGGNGQEVRQSNVKTTHEYLGRSDSWAPDLQKVIEYNNLENEQKSYRLITVSLED
ncbi:hypothetical protein CHS0354_024776, partial [Potamilus streckersoni]